MASKAASVSGNDKVKLIAVSVVLVAAVGWIIYFMMPSGPSNTASGVDPEVAKAEYEKEKAEIDKEQQKLPPAIRDAPPAGS